MKKSITVCDLCGAWGAGGLPFKALTVAGIDVCSVCMDAHPLVRKLVEALAGRRRPARADSDCAQAQDVGMVNAEWRCLYCGGRDVSAQAHMGKCKP